MHIFPASSTLASFSGDSRLRTIPCELDGGVRLKGLADGAPN